MVKHILYDEFACSSCGCEQNSVSCDHCITDIGCEFYRLYRKLAPKADKIVIVAKNINWQGRTGYLVVDFNHNIMRNIMNKTSSYTKQFYQEGRKMYILGSNHDVPTGGVWELHPVVSRGRTDDALIQSVVKNKKAS